MAAPQIGISRRRVFAATAGIGAMLIGGPAAAAEPKATRRATMQITRSGTQPSGKGPAEYFTGAVRVDPLFKAQPPARAVGGHVTFEPGARTAWHTHPLGQTLIVTRPGDIVWFSAGEKHWHSGMPSHVSAHLNAEPSVTSAEVRERMSRNICRCGAYSNIVN